MILLYYRPDLSWSKALARPTVFGEHFHMDPFIQYLIHSEAVWSRPFSHFHSYQLWNTVVSNKLNNQNLMAEEIIGNSLLVTTHSVTIDLPWYWINGTYNHSSKCWLSQHPCSHLIAICNCLWWLPIGIYNKEAVTMWHCQLSPRIT